MAETQASRQIVRFGAFEAEMQTGELRKNGVKLKFGGQPFQVLAILLERPGDLVTRKELQERLWRDTFVDFEDNINTAVNRIRELISRTAQRAHFDFCWWKKLSTGSFRLSDSERTTMRLRLHSLRCS